MRLVRGSWIFIGLQVAAVAVVWYVAFQVENKYARRLRIVAYVAAAVYAIGTILTVYDPAFDGLATLAHKARTTADSASKHARAAATTVSQHAQRVRHAAHQAGQRAAHAANRAGEAARAMVPQSPAPPRAVPRAAVVKQ